MTEEVLPSIIDNAIAAEVVMNDLIKGMKRSAATRYLSAQVDHLQIEDHRADDHAGNLLNYYIDSRNSVFGLSGLTISCDPDGFKQELLRKASAFILLDDNAKSEYLKAVNFGEKLTAKSFLPKQLAQ
ncbi:hypothetical protein KKH13_01910 [Patescibacteria group bacterium]|nr:hypothetical protein [Patescibacteria group bacterium]